MGYLLGCCHSGFVHVLSDLSSRSGWGQLESHTGLRGNLRSGQEVGKQNWDQDLWVFARLFRVPEAKPYYLCPLPHQVDLPEK